MKIVIDQHIPFIKGIFEKFAQVVYVSANEINNHLIEDADTLIIRTRTLCNQDLLKNTKIKFIASATIGYDHIDTIYCKKNGISWTNAPGCNASSVEQYVLSCIMHLNKNQSIELSNKTTIGIIGVGNVGNRVSRACKLLGMNVLLNDPPRKRRGDTEDFVSLEMIQNEADVITFHVPLNTDGRDKTFHLCNQYFFNNLKKAPIIINSSRGEIIENKALKTAISNKIISNAIIDCWENEPQIDLELLNQIYLATPHIAGYSQDGKANATQMVVRAVSRFWELGIDHWQADGLVVPQNAFIEIDASKLSIQQVLTQAILSTYDVRLDDLNLRKNPNLFEYQRNNYPVRREFSAYSINLKNSNIDMVNTLTMMGFNVL